MPVTPTSKGTPHAIPRHAHTDSTAPYDSRNSISSLTRSREEAPFMIRYSWSIGRTLCRIWRPSLVRQRIWRLRLVVGQGMYCRGSSPRVTVFLRLLFCSPRPAGKEKSSEETEECASRYCMMARGQHATGTDSKIS